tara:strand:+ start:43940 stop:45949 length:2010 start_codon:yes stop_codon:yes gene_type:complete
MCGITGFMTYVPFSNEGQKLRQLSEMTDAIKHRGPDAEGFWSDKDDGIALGHRRLSVLDLSPTGAQPISSSDGHLMMVYNGEIYNHLALREKINAQGADVTWRGTSDSETLVEAMSLWGIEKTLKECCGMFSLAVWDRNEKVLTLARDNLGEKPLYFGHTPEGLVFASELKALCLGPGMRPQIDPTAMTAFLNYGYVPEGFCILRGVSKLKPGYTATFRLDRDIVEIRRFQGFEALALAGQATVAASEMLDLSARSSELEALLKGVVGEQMLSDVRLGCFLSGGVDSSLVACLMQAQGATQTRTFSIGFAEARFNEAPHAAKVAEHLKTDHTEFLLREEEALDLVPNLPDIYDEPFADSSQIPTVLLCREARKSVTVALTGDGADEIFGGYNRHVFGPSLWRKAARVPKWLRASAGRAASTLDGFAVSESSAVRRLVAKTRLPVTTLDKTARLVSALGKARDVEDIYAHFSQVFSAHDRGFDAGYRAQPDHLFSNVDQIRRLPHSEWMMAMDAVTYLPGDILVKVDRAAMYSSLETRAPFLDPRVVQAAWSLPQSARVDGNTGKVILRDILYRHVPRELIERPKQGFSIPLDRWLRGALRVWADNLLKRRDLLDIATLDTIAVNALWDDHINKRANNGQKLWVLLMLLAWIDHYSDVLGFDQTAQRISV